MSSKLPAIESIGESIRPITALPKGVSPGTMVGVDDRPTDDRIVAIAIRIRTPVCRVGDREFSASNMCIHELCIAKRFYEEQAGTLTWAAGWPPDHARLVPLTQAKLEIEAVRIFNTYAIPRETGVINLAPDYLGAEPGERLRRLHMQMEKQYRAWIALYEKTRSRVHQPADVRAAVVESLVYDHMTEAELNEIVDMGDPAKSAIGTFTLPQLEVDYGNSAGSTSSAPVLLDDIKKAAEVDTGADEHDRFIDGMGELDLTPDQFSAMIALLDGGKKPSMLTDDELIRALGNKAKLKAVRALIDG